MVLTTMLLTCFNIQALVRLNGGFNLSNLSYHSNFGGDDFGKVKLGFFCWTSQRYQVKQKVFN